MSVKDLQVEFNDQEAHAFYIVRMAIPKLAPAIGSAVFETLREPSVDSFVPVNSLFTLKESSSWRTMWWEVCRP